MAAQAFQGAKTQAACTTSVAVPAACSATRSRPPVSPSQGLQTLLDQRIRHGTWTGTRGCQSKDTLREVTRAGHTEQHQCRQALCVSLGTCLRHRSRQLLAGDVVYTHTLAGLSLAKTMWLDRIGHK